ncbi:MAG TPA: HAD hydrolase-like protein [Vicinamibacterales bacterium]|nr:HAD hydrolase-like protein [Vicinamibacterales bacterium]
MPMAAVVFDFDGVLADTEGLHLRAFQETFATRGWTLDAGAYADRYLGYDDRHHEYDHRHGPGCGRSNRHESGRGVAGDD